MHRHGDLLREVAVRDGGRDLGDVAHLVGEVAGQHVDVVGQVLPGAADALDVGLAAQLALGADLLRDARDLGRERAQLIDHRVDGVLELEDLALDVDGDLLRQVAVRDRGRDLGDVAHLRGQVVREQVDVVGQVLPGAGDAGHLRLRAQLALDTDGARDAGDLLGEDAERLGHAVERVGERGDLALRLDADQLLRQVAVGDRGDDLDDAAHLGGQVRGHEVDVVGQVLPGARHALHVAPGRPACLRCRPRARRASPRRRSVDSVIDHAVDGVGERRQSRPSPSTIIFC